MNKPLVLLTIGMPLWLPVRCVEEIQTAHETINGSIMPQTQENRVPLTG